MDEVEGVQQKVVCRFSGESAVIESNSKLNFCYRKLVDVRSSNNSNYFCYIILLFPGKVRGASI
jgi:hypothetical protein